MINKNGRILPAILLIYLLCFMFRVLEYFVLRTDQTVFGEAFIHKLIGIAILCIVTKAFGYDPKELGFTKGRVLINVGKGLLFGLSVFLLAYMAEIIIIAIQGKFEALDLYVSAYAVDGNIGNQTAVIFFVICVVGNIINVIMEEGIFRGLFPKMLEKKYSFIIAAIIASFLFGIWHVMAPIRNYYDGTMSLGGFIANMIMLVLTSGLVGFKFAMMRKMTGNLYMSMGDHFVNNTIVNMLHVVSNTGTDELMVVRIAIAQTVSFIIVMVWYVISLEKHFSCHDFQPPA